MMRRITEAISKTAAVRSTHYFQEQSPGGWKVACAILDLTSNVQNGRSCKCHMWIRETSHEPKKRVLRHTDVRIKHTEKRCAAVPECSIVIGRETLRFHVPNNFETRRHFFRYRNLCLRKVLCQHDGTDLRAAEQGAP